MKKMIVIISLILILNHSSYAAGDVLSAIDYATLGPVELNNKMRELVNRYPEVLSIVSYGQSTDGKEMLALRFTDSPALADTVDYGVNHILIESGTHARETANPYITLKTLEWYVKDYYDDKVIPSIHMKKLFDENCLVIHVLPLTNPDGYGLVKKGLSTVKNDGLRNKLRSQYTSFDRLKGNVNGVDLNRNYTGDFYSVEQKKWLSIWGRTQFDVVSRSAGLQFYPGLAAASEIETRNVMKYIDRYDFRLVLSYHSVGRVIYHDRVYLNLPEFDKLALDYALVARKISNYQVMFTSDAEKKNQESGFLGDYFANAHLKPAITLETGTIVSSKDVLVVEEDYHKTKLILGEYIKKAIAYGKFRYVVLDKYGNYYRDYINEAYAIAVSKKIGGKVIDTINMQ